MAHPALSFKLSRAVLSTIKPPIPHAYKWSTHYKPSPGRPLLDMSQGVPGTPPPNILLDALARSANNPSTTGLRNAIVEEMRHVYATRNGGIELKDVDVEVDVSSGDVAITAGCNLAFVASVMCLADPGDEVILPVPCMSLNLLGIKSVPLHTLSDEGFIPSLERCEKLITPKTKAIALVTPNNPTGAIYPPSLIAGFAALAQKHNIALILDETYRDFVDTAHGPPHTLFSSTTSAWSWRSTVVHLFSFSKSYCIPGHRLGLIAASPALLQHITTTLDCLQICAPRPAQLALATPGLLPILRRESIAENARALKARHALFRKALPDGWEVGSQGGYFAFVKHPFRGVSATEVCQRLAEDLGVVVLPVQFFCESGEGGDNLKQGVEDNWVRFSVANVDDEKVLRVCERLRECGDKFGWNGDVGSR
ncbi:pyridoxal phosphate-dependent transferase [Hygrophoropsis aurantiaca]|uniref:Pyridoxal phosphate-dependent transferase n=1 Tax=Hygrophoropsis aurantiaca TaxID=72124 RepID=A0ACB8A0B7_9AGAM|nr:pyridoxal phosphate-dependent transferase [Hygrophoropsis aurantiaca]